LHDRVEATEVTVALRVTGSGCRLQAIPVVAAEG